MDLKRKLGCLHAHYSNIDYMENALAAYDVELIHFVDPALMHRVTFDNNFKSMDAQIKVKEQLEWIAQCNVDGILITCTNYIALLQEEQLSISVPIFKIDEPYFEIISNIKQPQIILFTNPATVNGTMERLNRYAEHRQKTLDIDVIVLNDTFKLIMLGLKQEYDREISEFINTIIKEGKVISVAQLSMVDAAKEVENKTSSPIINPLDTLITSLVSQLKLRKMTLGI